MAQLTPIKLEVDMSEIHEARILVRRLKKDVDGLNRTLARLEATAVGLQIPLLEEFGIRLEVSDV